MIRDLMIGGASVEDTLTLWASSLRDAKQRIRRLFTQERVAASAGEVFGGLFGNEPRKRGWVVGGGGGRKGPAIEARGASRRFWAGGIGMRTRCATSCVSTHWKRLAMRTRSWSSMRQAF